MQLKKAEFEGKEAKEQLYKIENDYKTLTQRFDLVNREFENSVKVKDSEIERLGKN